MKKLFYLIILIILLGLTQTALAKGPEEIAQMWKERGFVALSRLDSLKDKHDPRSRYQFLLEFAFAMHATSGESNHYAFVHKTGNGLDFYKIVLNKAKIPTSKTGVDEEGLCAINYIYDQKTGEFVSVKVELLPKGWYIHASPNMPNTILLDVNHAKIFILFDVLNPLNPVVGSFP